MDYIIALVYGIVQGLTEFLPVSSSGHLVLMHRIMPLPFASSKSFDVMLHLGTLVAVVWYFRSDILSILVSWFNSLKTGMKTFSNIGWLIIFGTIPAGLAGVIFGDYIDKTMDKPIVVASMLVVVGLLFLLVENKQDRSGELASLNLNKTLAIGLAQAAALIPGTSRSGATIIAGMFGGLKREVAVRFSFLLSIPIIFGAAVVEMPDLYNDPQIEGNKLFLIIAFISATVSAFWAIKYMLEFVKKFNLKPFAYYRFILAFIIFMLIAIN